MDAVVTTPKSEIENAKKEGDAIQKSGGHWFRIFKFKPKVEPSEKLFFVENGEITGCGTVFSVEQVDVPQECDITGREWGGQGDWIVRYRNWKWLDDRPKMKGFQGIRYVERLSEKIQAKLRG